MWWTLIFILIITWPWWFDFIADVKGWQHPAYRKRMAKATTGHAWEPPENYEY